MTLTIGIIWYLSIGFIVGLVVTFWRMIDGKTNGLFSNFVALIFVWPIMVISITLLMLTCNVPEIQMRMKGKQPYVGQGEKQFNG